MDAKHRDELVAKDDRLGYLWDCGARWAQVKAGAGRRGRGRGRASRMRELVWTNNLSEPEE